MLDPRIAFVRRLEEQSIEGIAYMFDLEVGRVQVQ
jgi:hypothetical protein